MSYAVQNQPRQTDHGGEFWQNVIHWRREWQTTSAFLPWEPHELYENVKDEFPRSVSIQHAPGEEQRKSSRKNEEAEPKQKIHPVVNVSSGESKFDAVEGNIA